MRPREKDPSQVEFYEGLVLKTASKNMGYWDDDFEDLCQFLRFKVWRALESFKPEKSRVPIERYVFSCVLNGVKDVWRRKRRNELFIEDLRRRPGQGAGGLDFDGDAFDEQYLATEGEEVHEMACRPGLFAGEEEIPDLPNTLSAEERVVTMMLYMGRPRDEIAAVLETTKPEVAKILKTVREKMADWRPASPQADPEPQANLSRWLTPA